MNSIVFVLALATFISTLVGGILAIRFKKSLHYFFAFSAGSLVAVALLDLLPESLNLSKSNGLDTSWIFGIVVFSFLIYSFLERFFLTHHHHDDEGHGHIIGQVGAGSLAIHSFFDGIAIGAAFQVNPSVGLIVALAVLSHDFTDGVNTVTLMLKNRHKIKSATIFLLMDAIAPVLGVILASLLVISPVALSLILAFFVGEFLYLGATNLLPETYKHESWLMALCTVLGAAVIFVLTRIIA